MALFAIADLHFAFSVDKPMDIFGEGWSNYVERIREGFSELGSEDVTVLCGDLSWGMSLQEAREDFAFLDALPGKKLLMKGNHDYWWTTVSKMNQFFQEETGRNGKKLRSPWGKGERSRENSRNRGDGAGLGHGACFKIRESPDWSPATA